jgi:ribosome maturation factor RimP
MMFADSLMPTLESLARRAAEAEGLDLAWIELQRQGGSFVFRVFIERACGNTGLTDCERVSSRLGLLLDVEDPIESAYTLEVSTPGLDRPLHGEKDYERFAGRLARVKTKEAFQGRRRLVGRLVGVREGNLLLDETDLGAVSVPLALIEVCRLEVEIEDLGSASGAKRSERRRKRQSREKKTRSHDPSQRSQESQARRKRA